MTEDIFRTGSDWFGHQEAKSRFGYEYPSFMGGYSTLNIQQLDPTGKLSNEEFDYKATNGETMGLVDYWRGFGQKIPKSVARPRMYEASNGITYFYAADLDIFIEYDSSDSKPYKCCGAQSHWSNRNLRPKSKKINNIKNTSFSSACNSVDNDDAAEKYDKTPEDLWQEQQSSGAPSQTYVFKNKPNNGYYSFVYITHISVPHIPWPDVLEALGLPDDTLPYYLGVHNNGDLNYRGSGTIITEIEKLFPNVNLDLLIVEETNVEERGDLERRYIKEYNFLKMGLNKSSGGERKTVKITLPHSGPFCADKIEAHYIKTNGTLDGFNLVTATESFIEHVALNSNSWLNLQHAAKNNIPILSTFLEVMNAEAFSQFFTNDLLNRETLIDTLQQFVSYKSLQNTDN